MNTKTLKTIVVGAAFASALALPPIAHAQEPSSPMPKSASTDSKVAGKITEKTGTGITVSGQSISVNTATAITKDGERIKLNDLKVGDKVAVSTIKTDDGRLLAVTVEVTSTT